LGSRPCHPGIVRVLLACVMVGLSDDTVRSKSLELVLPSVPAGRPIPGQRSAFAWGGLLLAVRMPACRRPALCTVHLVSIPIVLAFSELGGQSWPPSVAVGSSTFYIMFRSCLQLIIKGLRPVSHDTVQVKVPRTSAPISAGGPPHTRTSISSFAPLTLETAPGSACS